VSIRPRVAEHVLLTVRLPTARPPLWSAPRCERAGWNWFRLSSAPIESTWSLRRTRSR